MKSTKEELLNRGYLEEGEEVTFSPSSLEEKLDLLQSKIPIERTLAARLLILEESPLVITQLLNALKTEKKLYPKIEITRTLVTYGEKAVNALIQELGKIGANQHKSIPEKKFGKNNYPLPRDIVARTLAHIGTAALPELLKVLDNKDEKQITEAIDAIGFICFYNYQASAFEKLNTCYIQYSENKLICWKIIQAMSAFPESNSFLFKQKKLVKNERLEREINRSLQIIGNKNNK